MRWETEEKKVRLAAKALLKRLLEEAPKVLVQDWFKDGQTRLMVRDAVGEVLHKSQSAAVMDSPLQDHNPRLRISCVISAMNSSSGFAPRSSLSRWRTETVPSSASRWPMTSM
jgi:hypothetical protein